MCIMSVYRSGLLVLTHVILQEVMLFPAMKPKEDTPTTP